MNRKMRAKIANAEAKVKKARKARDPICEACGEPESAHDATLIALVLIEALEERDRKHLH